jgi:dTDP-4-dehydrorhamnose reductase
MMRLAVERDAINVIDDQVGAPTCARLLADVTGQVIGRLLSGQGAQGVYHCVAAGETSWFDYARFVIEWARSSELPVKVAPDAIRPVPTSACPTPARRSLNSRLSTARLSETFSLSSLDFQAGDERMLRATCGRYT